MASTTASMADIAQSSGIPSFPHANATSSSTRGASYGFATNATTGSSPSQAPAPASEPPVSPSITSSVDDSGIPGAISPVISLPDTGLAPMVNASDGLDETVLEALRKPGDRLQVLKFADSMEHLINERSVPSTRNSDDTALIIVPHHNDSATKPNPRGTLSSPSTYHRMLIHRCCAYYKLTVEIDHLSKSIIMIATTESRIPSKRISEFVPQEPVALPTFKIMRRSTPEQRSKGRNSSVPTPSSASATDSTPSLDNSGSSETGSGSPPRANSLNSVVSEGNVDDEILKGLGLPQKQSRTANGASTPRKTLQERQAEYEVARSRIFSDLDQREKEAAKMREDQEREREVRDLHRQLAEEEEAVGEHGRNTHYGAGSYPNGTAPPQDGSQRMIGASHQAPSRDQTRSVPATGARVSVAPAASPAPSMESETAPLVSYPTLYDPDATNYDGTASSSYPVDPSATSPYDTHSHQTYLQGPPQAPHPHYNGNPYPSYPPMGLPSGPPNMNGGHSMMMTPMGSYPPYHGMQPNQQLPPVPHGQMPPPNGMNMPSYPMYSQPPANGWGDHRQAPPPGSYPAQGGPDPNQNSADQPYGMYPRPMPQNPYWQPGHPPMGNPEMPPPPPPVGRGPYPPPPPNVPPSGQNYMQPPPPPFYNPGMQQHQPPYPPQQGQQPFPPPPPPSHGPQYAPPYHPGQQPQRQGPGSQHTPPRQLWNPPGPQIGGKRGGFGGPSRPPQQQHQHHQRPGRDGGQQRPGASRGPSIREMRETKDYGNGPASLIATPMSPPASVRSRSRNSSISERSVSRGPALWPSGGPEGLSPLPMRGGRLEINGRPVGPDMGDRRRSGSISGSVAESVSESGAVTPLDETASLASSTMSSASSTRTFTSTSSKHPSLPSRPDFPQGLPMHRMYSTGSNASRSSQGSVRGKSASSSTSHSRTQSFQSQGRPSPYAALGQADFPPLPGMVNAIGHLPTIPHSGAPRPNNAWTGNTRTILMVGGPLPEQSQDHARPPQLNRFEEQDAKFTRPPAKAAVTLYDPKHPTAGKAAAQATTQAPAAVTAPAVGGGSEADSSSKLLAERLEQLAVGEHSAGSGAS
ncbi:hypothetical protein FRB90_009781 [Tulasnella sp. 427]|nr:hypothetical protein FRB90_009781 [Tulasnella sp. 427]